MSKQHAAWAGRLIAAHMGHESLPAIDIVPIVKRQDSYERVIALHREAHNHDASKDVKEAIAAKLRELKDD